MDDKHDTLTASEARNISSGSSCDNVRIKTREFEARIREAADKGYRTVFLMFDYQSSELTRSAMFCLEDQGFLISKHMVWDRDWKERLAFFAEW